MVQRSYRRVVIRKKHPRLRAALIALGVLLAIFSLLAALKMPDTIRLDRNMDEAADRVDFDGTEKLVQAIRGCSHAANLRAAREMTNEMIRDSLKLAAFNMSVPELEKFENALENDPSWKVFATDENRQLMADCRAAIAAAAPKQIRQIALIRKLTFALTRNDLPDPRLIAAFLAAPVPSALSRHRAEMLQLGYTAAVAGGDRDLADRIAGFPAVDTATLNNMIEHSCTQCRGSGMSQCSICIVSPGICTACGGAGVMTVQALGRKNFQTIGTPCKKCSGGGKCVACNGQGRRVCFFCKGKGKRLNTQYALRSLREGAGQFIVHLDTLSRQLNSFIGQNEV